MLTWLTLHDRLWSWLEYLPLVLALAAGVSLAVGLLGVRGWAPRCRRCGHDLRATLDATACPECGADLARRDAVRQGAWRIRTLPLLLGLVMLALAGLTAPGAPWRPVAARRALVTFVPSREVLGAMAATRRASAISQEFQRRMALAEPEFVNAIVDAACEEVSGGGPIGASTFTTIRDLAKADHVDRASQLRINDAIVAALQAQKIAPSAIFGAIQNLGDDQWTDELSRRVLAVDAAADALVTVEATPQSILVGTSGALNVRVGKSFSPNLAGMLDVRADRVSYRLAGTDEWSAIRDDEETRHERIGFVEMIPFPARNLQPGEYEVRCELTAERVAAPGGGSGRANPPPAPLRLTRIVPVKVIAASEIKGSPRRDDAAREFAQNLLADIRIDLLALEGVPSLSFRRAFSSPAGRSMQRKPGAKLYIVGNVTIEQDGHSWQAGTVTLGASRMTYGGATTQDESNGSATLDPNKPVVVRITPAPDAARGSMREDFEYLDAVVELQLDRTGRAPSAVVIQPAPAAQAP